ncbi:MAG TPA: magnesium chelatase, partial [Methanophagales archaeon]|nr:magnesium chelatase [Methanophagales archaeon]
VRTHRAEIVIDRTAKTIAALDGRKKVTFEDIKEAMELALPHRMRRKPFEPPSLDTEKLDDMMSNKKKQHEKKQENKQQKQRKEEEEKREQKHKNEQPDKNQKSQDDNEDDIKEPQKESVFNIGDPIDTKAVRQKQKKDKTYRRKISGRRIPTLSLRNNGKYVRHGFPKGEIKDVALDATIRTAAPYQKERRVDSDSDLAVVIKTQDIREKIRVGKVSTATMFVVDASGSMGANRRMESAKGAVLSLLLENKRRGRRGKYHQIRCGYFSRKV